MRLSDTLPLCGSCGQMIFDGTGCHDGIEYHHKTCRAKYLQSLMDDGMCFYCGGDTADGICLHCARVQDEDSINALIEEESR